MTDIFVGTSGWSYPEWKTDLYDGVPQRRWLARYAEMFDSVEVNITYRRDATPKMATAWLAATPESFRFALKAHQRATHFNRLKSPAEDAASQATQATLLGDRLGVVYFQMPHNFVRDDELLETFLAEWPTRIPAVWEFMHPSWHHHAVHDLLRQHAAGWVVSDAKIAGPVFETTAADAYVRLRRDDYPPGRLSDVVASIRHLDADRVWVFVRHGADAPALAAAVRDALA